MAKIILAARFTADGAQVVREFDKMGAAGVKMGDRVKQGANAMSPALSAVDAAAGEARGAIEGMAGRAGPAGTVLRSLGPAGLAAAAGIGVAITAFVALQGASRNAVRDLGAIASAADRLGVSTSKLQEWRFAVIGAGQAATDADRAILDFNERIGEAQLTNQGAAFMALTRDLGFTREDIAGFGSAEDSLEGIADAISRLNNAATQTRVARELGLEPLLPVLQQGAGAFDRAAAAAREMGYVLDRELLDRAAEFNGQWSQAAEVIDVQFKSALIDLAPYFIELARAIAGATRDLVDFLDRFKEIEDRASGSLRRQLARASADQALLTSRFGPQVTTGGDPRRGHLGTLGALGIVETDDIGRGVGGLDLARHRYAYLEQQAQRLIAEINSRPASSGAGGAGVRPPAALNGGSASSALNQHQQFINQLREEMAARDALLAVQREFPKASQEEAEARLALAEQMRRIDEARAAGIEISDAELQRLRELTKEHYATAAAARDNAASQARYNATAAANDRHRELFESPRDRLNREIGAVQRQEGITLTSDQVAQQVRRLREEYEELARSQREASFQGQLLAGIVQGQVRDFGDLTAMLRDLATDAVFRELLAGGVMGEGGLGGFASRVVRRIGDSLSGGEGFDLFDRAARDSAKTLTDAFVPNLAKSALETALGTTAKSAETLGVYNLTAAMSLATGAVQVFAASLATAGASNGVGDLLGAIGGGLTSGARGVGLAGGGSMLLGARHAGAELGPELAIFGGWSQVAPNEAVRGLSVLAQLSRAAAPAASAGSAPRIVVNVKNESGVAVDAQADAAFSRDGEVVIEVALTRKVNGDIARGKYDAALGSRYGVGAPRTRRS